MLRAFVLYTTTVLWDKKLGDKLLYLIDKSPNAFLPIDTINKHVELGGNGPRRNNDLPVNISEYARLILAGNLPFASPLIQCKGAMSLVSAVSWYTFHMQWWLQYWCQVTVLIC